MKVYIKPDKKDWGAIIARPVMDTMALQDKVRSVLQDVKANGDQAVRKYTLQFDGVSTEQLAVSDNEINEASQSLSPSLKRAIETAAGNIRLFHEKQVQRPEIIETMPGVKCWRRSVGIEKTGLYIPGGTAPLFSTVLMLGIPAKIAGCKEIILCTPPSLFSARRRAGDEAAIHPAILFAAQLTGVTKIFKVGGVQAIGAMAYGTETIPSVYKIFGPGNQYVNCAKQLVQLDGVAIDMPAGPSEICVLADETCNPAFVAADLLSQAEHGADSQVLLICSAKQIIDEVEKEMNIQLPGLPRREIARQVLDQSNAVVLSHIGEAVDLVNEYAPEHLILACREIETIANKIVNAGSVFLGNYSPESAGDYASGTNHTLPTNGFARCYSGVSVDSFVKKITYQQITKEGLLQVGGTVEQMAAAEGLDAHRNSISIRINADRQK
ncbi:MAG: histidinol dehydrogenase [Bacteroidota bacterium]|nr:histidinol dehydrogenase [Bacteroidota bacterium]